MGIEKDIEDAQKFLRNGAPRLGLAAGNNGHLEKHPLKTGLFLYNIDGKYFQENNQTRTFTEDEVRKYAGAQRMQEESTIKYKHELIEKENKPEKYKWVRGDIQGAHKKDSRSEETLAANLYLQAGVPEWGLEPNKGMFMPNPNNREEYLYIVKGEFIKDEKNKVRSLNKGEIAFMAFEHRVREDDERMHKAMR